MRPVLYIEDEENDALLVEFGFRRAGLAAPLKVLPDGRDAIEYLSGAGEYADRQRHPLPCLVLLDLNLPVVSGLEVLEWIRADAALKELPVVVFSSSDQPQDHQRAQALKANDYIVKPVDLGALEAIIRGLNDRWLKRAASGDRNGRKRGGTRRRRRI